MFDETTVAASEMNSATTAERERLARAQDFIWKNARLLERQLFAYLFGPESAGDGPSARAQREGVIRALRAYQNPDGGFGHALEPDLRAPLSQPVAVDFAFRVLDLVAAFDDPMVARACDYLQAITTPDGGIPFVLPSARDYPHAPWWETSDANPPASLNPTALLAGLLHKHHVAHPWLGPATDYCWDAIARSGSTEFHELWCVLTFLEFAPDRDRAGRELARVLNRIRQSGVVAADPHAEGYVQGPLDWAPAPASPARALFDDALIAAHLAALAARQQPDGGWPISFPPVSAAGELAWRGWVTIGALRTLQAYGA